MFFNVILVTPKAACGQQFPGKGVLPWPGSATGSPAP